MLATENICQHCLVQGIPEKSLAGAYVEGFSFFTSIT